MSKGPSIFAFGAGVSIMKDGAADVAGSCEVTDTKVTIRNALKEEVWSQALTGFGGANYKGAMPGGAEDRVEILPGPVVLKGPKADPVPFGESGLFHFRDWITGEVRTRRGF